MHPEDLALCQSSRVYPAEVDLQILRRYIRLGSNPSRLQLLGASKWALGPNLK